MVRSNRSEKDNDDKMTKYNYLNHYKRLRKEERNTYLILLEVLFIGILLGTITDRFFWHGAVGVTHSILELMCILLNMASFFIVWHKYKDSPASSRILGFGFLATTILYGVHIYFFEPLGLVMGDAKQLGFHFWNLARFTDAVIIYIASLGFKSKRITEGNVKGLLISILLPISISYIIINYYYLLPLMHDENGLTLTKIILETFIIFLTIISLLRYKEKIDERGYISYKYLSLALVIMIPTEVCFMLFKTYVSSIMAYGHVFRVIYCYFIYKSIFQGSIEYTYGELEKSKKKLKDILDAIPIGIETYDNNLTLKFANREIEKLLGYNKEDIIGLNSNEIYNLFKADDSTGSIIPEIKNKKIKGKNITKSMKRKDGQKIRVQVDGKNIEDGLLVMLKDAREEQDIRSLHIQSKAILSSMKSPAYICDNNNNFIAANKAYEKLVGISLSNILSMNMTEVLGRINYNPRNLKELEKDEVIEGQQFELRFTNVNGEEKDVILNISQIINIYGEVIGKITIVNDITDFKKQQEKILHNEKLALLGQMGATIVHETRNFLTTIKGCSQLIEMVAKENKVIDYARKININTDEVNGIISNFLSLSKPKNMITEEIGACDLIQSIKSNMETSSLINSVSVEFISNIDERYIICDETQITQVVLNMCKNAVEAMKGIENPRLIVESGVSEKDNGIYIKISDNGIGMSKETLSKLGTAFFTTKQSGTGLGISVCYDIVKQHRGTIDVISEEGVGTTFTINIPGIEDDISFDNVKEVG